MSDSSKSPPPIPGRRGHRPTLTVEGIRIAQELYGETLDTLLDLWSECVDNYNHLPIPVREAVVDTTRRMKSWRTAKLDEEEEKENPNDNASKPACRLPRKRKP